MNQIGKNQNLKLRGTAIMVAVVNLVSPGTYNLTMSEAFKLFTSKLH
jgi:hypothetical protein